MQRMNNILARADEIVREKFIHIIRVRMGQRHLSHLQVICIFWENLNDNLDVL